jgi:hypothetical protein
LEDVPRLQAPPPPPITRIIEATSLQSLGTDHCVPDVTNTVFAAASTLPVADTPVTDTDIPELCVTEPTAPVPTTPVTDVEELKLTVTEPTAPVPTTPVTDVEELILTVTDPTSPVPTTPVTDVEELILTVTDPTSPVPKTPVTSTSTAEPVATVVENGAVENGACENIYYSGLLGHTTFHGKPFCCVISRNSWR